MGGWIVWAVLAGALLVAQRATGRLRLTPLALAAALAAIAGAMAGLAASAIAFLLALVAVLVRASRHPGLGRAQARRRPGAARSARRRSAGARGRAGRGATIRDRSAVLVGRDAIVVERIANRHGVGIVDIGGQVWNARALHEDDEIDAGERVEVVEVRGTTALVA